MKVKKSIGLLKAPTGKVIKVDGENHMEMDYGLITRESFAAVGNELYELAIPFGLDDIIKGIKTVEVIDEGSISKYEIENIVAIRIEGNQIPAAVISKAINLLDTTGCEIALFLKSEGEQVLLFAKEFSDEAFLFDGEIKRVKLTRNFGVVELTDDEDEDLVTNAMVSISETVEV